LQRAICATQIFRWRFARRFAGASGFVQREFARRGTARREFDGRNLYGAEGLWLGRLGGANLYDAMLPETISSIDGSKALGSDKNGALVLFPDAHRQHDCFLVLRQLPTRD